MRLQRSCRASSGRRRSSWLAALALLFLVLGTSSPIEAATRGKAKGSAHLRAKKHAGRHLSRKAAARARLEAQRKAEAEAVAGRKAAVFTFEGDETEPLRLQVVRLLRANGMHVQTDLRPTDTAEQFRDMAAALNLAIYVHGRLKSAPGGQAALLITIRSGVTGRKIATASFQGRRHELAPLVEEGLWQRVRRPLVRACIDAHGPRRHNAPMRIEAGTPIEDDPRWREGT